jgi:hypothetical protein
MVKDLLVGSPGIDDPICFVVGSLLQMPASYGRDRSKVTKTCGNLAIFVGKKRRPQRSCRRNFVILEINICATSVFQ